MYGENSIVTKSNTRGKEKNGSDRSRIDFWLLDNTCSYFPLVKSTDIRPAIIDSTDHLAISFKLKYVNKRGPGFWKLTNSLLSDDTYCDLIRQVINDTKSLDIKNHILKWELCKIKVRELSIEYCKRKAQERNNRLQTLEKQLHNIYENRAESNITGESITYLEKEIKEIYDFKTNGAIIRSRVKFLEEGEKCNKYFLNMEKNAPM